MQVPVVLRWKKRKQSTQFQHRWASVPSQLEKVKVKHKIFYSTMCNNQRIWVNVLTTTQIQFSHQNARVSVINKIKSPSTILILGKSKVKHPPESETSALMSCFLTRYWHFLKISLYSIHHFLTYCANRQTNTGCHVTSFGGVNKGLRLIDRWRFLTNMLRRLHEMCHRLGDEGICNHPEIPLQYVQIFNLKIFQVYSMLQK